jgi:hypothetical protein
MQGRKPQDRFYLGLGACARHIGALGDAFRPGGRSDPLDPRNRFLRLPAALRPAKGNANHTNVYGDALWHGLFDASYLRPGDYLVVDAAIYFVASREPLLPVLCVRTNRTISISRASMQTGPALNGYGGYTPLATSTLIEGWPAAIFSEGRSGTPPAGLPTDQAPSLWNVYLPPVPGTLLSAGDIVADDIGRTAIIVSSELTNLGWRLSAKMATT